MEQIMLICENSIDGIFSAVYEGFVIRNERFPLEYNDCIRICTKEEYNFEMFTEYIEVETDLDKALKTAKSIRKKLGEEIYFTIINAICNFENDRASIIFGFLIRGFKIGPNIIEMQHDDFVIRVIELAGKTVNESHLFKGFVRFKDMGKTLYSKIEPRCNVVPLIAEHFAERYPNENWIIYDATHKLSAVHKRYEGWVLVTGEDMNIEAYEGKDAYEELWKVFFKTIAIAERTNPRQQNSMIPKWYRTNMPEYQN